MYAMQKAKASGIFETLPHFNQAGPGWCDRHIWSSSGKDEHCRIRNVVRKKVGADSQEKPLLVHVFEGWAHNPEAPMILYHR